MRLLILRRICPLIAVVLFPYLCQRQLPFSIQPCLYIIAFDMPAHPVRSEERRVGKECRSLCDWSSDVCSSDLTHRCSPFPLPLSASAPFFHTALPLHYSL